MAKTETTKGATVKGSDKAASAPSTNGNGNGSTALSSASEKHTGSLRNDKVEGARVRTGASGKVKAYLPPIATRKKMLAFASTLATKTSKRLKKWTAEKAEFAPIAKQIDSAIVALQSAMMDLDKLPQGWEPTRAVAAVNVGGFSVGDMVRIREKRHSQYADVLDKDTIGTALKVAKVGKSKIVLALPNGMSTVVTKAHLIDSKTSLDDERAAQKKIDDARKAAKEGTTEAKA